jgi:hypothetical protein
MAANLNLDVIFGRDNMRRPDAGCVQPTANDRVERVEVTKV